MLSLANIGNLHRSWEPPSPQSRSSPSPRKAVRIWNSDISRLLGPEPSGEWPPWRHWLPQLCPAPCFPPQSLTLGFPLSLHPDGGEGLSPHKRICPSPPVMEEPSWFGLPGRRAPAIPLFQGRLSLKSPAARREGCSRPPPSSPTELPKYREINRDPARERERARERARGKGLGTKYREK